MLTSRCKPFFERLVLPITRAFAAARVSPNAITLAVPPLVLLLCLWFVRTRHIVPFCVLMLLVAGLDAVDGALARLTGKVTRFGGYLDAMADRYVEATILLTVAYVTGYWLLSGLVLTGALLVSYAKARAALEVNVSNTEWPDFAERVERDLVFLAGFALSAVVDWRPLGRDVFWWTLVLLAVAVHVTVIQRMLRARRFIRERALQ